LIFSGFPERIAAVSPKRRRDMSSVAIQKFAKNKAPASFFKQVDALFDEIRQRAFSLFEQRGSKVGRDAEDWLAAEREILWLPPLDLVESDGRFLVRVAVPGFQAKEIAVTALPEAIFVEAESEAKKEETEGETRVSELASRKVYRKIDLPAPIDVDKTTAKLENGLLKLEAIKAGEGNAKKVRFNAARGAA
jgi:HSP20 family protein